MAVATRPPVPLPTLLPAPDRPRAPRARRTGRVPLLLVATGLAVAVGADGAALWRVVRVALAATAAVGLWRVLSRATPERRAVAAFAAGAPALAAGIGLGGPHLVKVGLTGLGFAGAALAVGGAVLLAQGAAGLLRPRGVRRLLLAPGLLLVLLATVLCLGQAVAATNVPRTTLGPGTPADLGLAYLEVEIPTADGAVLSGWYVPSTNGAAVVLLHGAGSTRTSVLDHAGVLAGHGYGVLLVDARGHGRSTGRAMDFGWYGDLDVSAAVSFLVAQPDVEHGRVAAVGLSMGGEEAIGALAADGRLRAVVAEGATNRVAGDKAWLSTAHGWRGAVQEGLEHLLYATTDLLTDASPPAPLREAVERGAPRPVLLIAGGATGDEADAARYIAGGAPGSVTVWVVPGAGHTGGLATSPEAWEDRVVGFLDAEL